MEKEYVVHPCYMMTNLYFRFAAFAIFSFLSVCSTQTYGQSDSLLASIAQQVNAQLSGSNNRGQRDVIWLSKEDDSVRMTSHGHTYTSLEILKPIFNKSIDSLLEDERYWLWIYYDEYSDRVFTAFSKLAKEPEGSFPNYSNAPPEPNFGMGTLLDIIHKDMRRHRPLIDSLWRHHNLLKPIEFVIDTTATVTLTGENPLLDKLDSVRRLKWEPAIYHAHPMNTLVGVRPSRSVIWSENELPWSAYRHETEIYYTNILPRKYKDSWVCFEKMEMGTQKPSRGRLLVSFVFNPITQQLESPIVHRGSAEEIHSFIEWLKQQHWPTRMFYWKQYPEATRSFFYVE